MIDELHVTELTLSSGSWVLTDPEYNAQRVPELMLAWLVEDEKTNPEIHALARESGRACVVVDDGRAHLEYWGGGGWRNRLPRPEGEPEPEPEPELPFDLPFEIPAGAKDGFAILGATLVDALLKGTNHRPLTPAVIAHVFDKHTKKKDDE